MNYNPTPREDFIKNNDRVLSHHKLIESDQMHLSLGVALLEYQRRQANLKSPDLGGYAACALRMQGVHEFLDVFLNLCETSQMPPHVDTTNLASNVKQAPTQTKRN